MGDALHEMTSLTAAQEWRRNWTVVLAGMLGDIDLRFELAALGTT